ncbi:hypothetical protein QCD60_30225 [Pokkaliibacter sp. MBI-7]|uniref:hypothetical protein n=1 Tax=Pokkaliibacter sp. MBI-7 TaxID=3040600 RepID=UPI00244B077D|nr:hypothetical protein [Pokkaliibacter sp. MBI-7]MDH2430998.1 hypothetical protein [Pokkaliibacter sp. MBI-7]MDH2436793.1 hypothetical protein [Pokkaliibacter sp. MBI-7]
MTAIYVGVTGGGWVQWAGTMMIQLVILGLMLRLEKPAPLSVILTWNKEERYAVWRPFAQFSERSLDALPEDRPDLSPEQRRLLLSEVHVPRLFAWSRYPATLCAAFERIDPVLASYTPTEQRMAAFVALQRNIQAAGTDVRQLAQHINRWVKADRQSIKTAAAATEKAG